jgi:hypothetical protein
VTFDFPRSLHVSQANFDDVLADAFSKPVSTRPQVGLHAVHGDALQIATALFEGLGFRVRALPAGFRLSGNPNQTAEHDLLVLPWNGNGEEYPLWKASTLPRIEATGVLR